MKPYNLIEDDEKASIKKLYYEKKSFEEISETLQVSRRAVSRILKEEGINTRLKNRYTLDENYFESINTEAKAYWLGFIFADGFVGDSDHNNIVITLIESDIDHILKFADAISYSGSLRDSGPGGYPGSKHRATLNFSNTKMAEDLRRHELYPGKSIMMSKIPDIPDELLRHFLRGYFDGDGSVYTARSTSYHKDKMYEYQKRYVSIIGTPQFLEGIAALMPFKHRIKLSRSEYMFYLEFYGQSETIDIYNYFYKDATVYLQRKYDKFQDILGPLCE